MEGRNFVDPPIKHLIFHLVLVGSNKQLPSVCCLQLSKMSAHEKNDESKEESLTTLLDEDQRGELTLLIASATAAMRKTITSSFDANVSNLGSFKAKVADVLRLVSPKTSSKSSPPRTIRS